MGLALAAPRHEAAQRLGAVLPWRPTEAAIAAAAANLAQVQKRARQRTLGESDLRAAVEIYEEAYALAERHGWSPHTLVVAMNGGCVPNAYYGRAETTYLNVSATRPFHVPGAQVAIQTGPGGISASRNDADKRPHGRGPTWRVSLDAREPGLGLHSTTERPPLRGATPRLTQGVLGWVW